MLAIYIILALLAILVIVFAARGLTIIKQAETMVIERLGKYHKTLPSGVNVIWPMPQMTLTPPRT